MKEKERKKLLVLPAVSSSHLIYLNNQMDWEHEGNILNEAQLLSYQQLIRSQWLGLQIEI